VLQAGLAGNSGRCEQPTLRSKEAFLAEPHSVDREWAWSGDRRFGDKLALWSSLRVLLSLVLVFNFFIPIS
jgi:hypothetical protein